MLEHERSDNNGVGYNTAVKQTIFAVEDDTDISRLVRHHLEAAGYDVRSFSSASGVIAEGEKQAPALFLLDIMLPGGDGLELCRRIRQTPALAMIPVIFLTAKTTESTATEFRLLEYLARHPGRVFTRDQLLDAVWRDTHYVTPRSVDVYVRRIREKIEANPDEPRHLKTVRGAGYRFEVPKP